VNLPPRRINPGEPSGGHRERPFALSQPSPVVRPVRAADSTQASVTTHARRSASPGDPDDPSLCRHPLGWFGSSPGGEGWPYNRRELSPRINQTARTWQRAELLQPVENDLEVLTQMISQLDRRRHPIRRRS